MNIKQHIKKSTFLVGLAVLTFAACHKKSSTENTFSSEDNSAGYASDYARMENNSNDVISIADDAALHNGANLKVTSSHPHITVDTSVTPHVLTIDFGTIDDTGLDGRVRRGKIIVYYTGHYRDSGSTHTITYNNYYIQDNKLTGYKTVTNNGVNSAGQLYYSVSVNDTLNFADGTDTGRVTWTGNRTRTWVEGDTTATRHDDVYSIIGSTTLTRADGASFTFNITSPLIVALNCLYIEKGTIEISSTSTAGGSRTLDYGDGSCDNKATLTIGSITHNITLRP